MSDFDYQKSSKSKESEVENSLRFGLNGKNLGDLSLLKGGLDSLNLRKPISVEKNKALVGDGSQQ